MRTRIRAAYLPIAGCLLSAAMLASAHDRADDGQHADAEAVDDAHKIDGALGQEDANAGHDAARSFEASERDAARARAKKAIEQSGAAQDLHEDTTLDGAPMQTRERSIPRKIDLDRLPSVGCTPKDPSQRPQCGGCGGCAGPAASGSSLSTVAQLLVAVLAVLLLSFMAYLISKIWGKRRYPTHRSAQVHTLLNEARSLDPGALENALNSSDYNRAIHALFLRTLLALYDAGYTLREDWTPREIARRIDASAIIKEPLSALVHYAEQARFRHTTMTRDDFERAERAAAAITTGLREEGR